MNDSRGRGACRVYKPLSPTLPASWGLLPAARRLLSHRTLGSTLG